MITVLYGPRAGVRCVAKKIAAIPAMIEALERFENVGLIATDGKNADSAHVHPELESALNHAHDILMTVR